MKKFRKLFLMGMVGMLFVMNGYCQTKMTEGRIVYSANFRDTTNLDFLDKMNVKDFNFWFKGNKNRAEYDMGFGNIMVQLFDEKTHDKIVFGLDDIKKEAAKIQNADKDIKGQKSPGNKFKYLDETKIICGYKCKKAEFTNSADTTKLYVYYTNEFIASLSPNLKYVYYDLKGYPMEFNQFINGKEFVTTISKISFEKIDDKLLNIPKGYKLLTVPMLKK